MRVEGFDFPDDLLYMRGHVWVGLKDKTARIGLTSLGSSLTKEIVHVDLPDNGEEFNAMEPMASFETIKSVTEVSAPFKCMVSQVNETLLDDPSLINKDPYGEGWILEASILEDSRDNLMDVKSAAEYFKNIFLKEKERYAGIYE
ncbi:MAG: glycine cleavage system protein H [Candidatus Altiarchaeota archaeon]|nr:glycine cleavage system protein H [Candidatus Altiarchaeota archaeon]